jgi:reactive chlorine resistance protein C
MRHHLVSGAQNGTRRLAQWVAGPWSEQLGIQAMRIAIAIVFLWIGALKFVPYEADSITPFVANNPVMRLFYKHPGEYKAHLTREGELVPAEREWQTNNNTYGFSQGLGIVEVLIGLLTLIGLFSPRYGLAGAMLSLLTPLVTLSFLITTPEAWVGNLGDANFGFPFLSGAGRLVIKDVLLFAGSWLVVVDCVRDSLRNRKARFAEAIPECYLRPAPALKKLEPRR